MQRTIRLYYEIRTVPTFGPPTPAAADIARHLQSRQYLGVTIVVCQNPLAMLSAARKQWLRLARNLQKQRASTLNAEEILRFTHTIMHMQHLQFAAKIPTDQEGAHIFFVTPDELTTIPPGCLSLYITTAPRVRQLKHWINDLSADALVVDYEGGLGLDALGLESKDHIESRLLKEWTTLEAFMQRHGVHINDLVHDGVSQAAAIDEALDSLLSAGNDFLREAANFQHIMSLSQPLKTVSATQMKQFEVVMRLAHRVQALTPGTFGTFLVKTFGDHNAESFFLRDATPESDELIEQSEAEGALQEYLGYLYPDTPAFTIFTT